MASNKISLTTKDKQQPVLGQCRQPNFFIIGAAKSGTTSLWMYLNQHPEIYMPQVVKEPSFFCYLCGCGNFQAYLRFFAGAKEEKAIGEASHAYLTSPESAAWIHQTYPEAKIIIILRNPVDRAYSLYNWMIREGYEGIYPFEKALAVESDRIADQNFKFNNPQYYYNYLYFHSGLYKAQIERYFNLFPQQQIQLLLFEDLKTAPVATTQKIYAFLGVDSRFVPQVSVHNQAKTPFSVPVQYFLKQKVFNGVRKLYPPVMSRVERGVLAANLWLGCSSPSLNAQTRHRLQERYREDIQRTASLIGRNLDAWLKK